MEKKSADKFSRLKQRAEKVLKQSATHTDPSQELDLKSLIHDLQVHQVELELQNVELTRTQDDLQVARENYYQLFDQAPVAYISVDRTGIIHKVNQAFQTMTGLPTPHLLNRPLVQFICLKYQNDFLSILKQFIAHRKEATLEVQLEGEDQKVINAQLNIKVLEKPDQAGDNNENIVISITDITQLKTAQAELKESRARMRNIIEDIPAMVCRFDAAGLISYSNAEFDHHFDTTPFHGQAPNFFDAMPEGQQEILKTEFSGLTPLNPVKTIEIPLPGKEEDEEKWQRWTIRTIFDEADKPRAYQTVGQDITDFKRIQKEKEEKEKLKSLVELSGAVCHELRQPLQVIIGLVELINLNLGPNKEMEKDADQLKKQVQRINAALNQLDHIARYETKSYVGMSRIIDLKKSCERRQHQRVTPNRPLSLEFHDRPSPLAPIVDISKGGLSFKPPEDRDYTSGDNALWCRILDQSQNILVDQLNCNVVPEDPVSLAKSNPKPGEVAEQRLQFIDLTRSQLQRMEALIRQLTPEPPQ